ncbi:MAG: hypothetical protein KGZ82_07635 [Bacteroidales bacterium]|nr:hypothetical protein [Bacteroidales bacterium]
MKTFWLVLLVFVLGIQPVWAQYSASQVKMVNAMRTFDELMAVSYPEGDARCQITKDGVVEQWDSTFTVRFAFDLRDIDFEKAEVVQVEKSDYYAIFLPCRFDQNCIERATTGKKTKYFRSTNAFVMPAMKQKQLGSLMDALINIQRLLP